MVQFFIFQSRTSREKENVEWNEWGLAAFARSWVISDFPFFFQLLDVLVDTQLRNGADGTRAYLKRYPFVRFRNEKLFGLQVWVKAAARFRIGVGNIVPCNRLLSRQVANS
jgi:hypothetical protein